VFECLHFDHFRWDAETEFLHLFSDAFQESEARPAADQHYGKDGNSGEVHGHRGPGLIECVPNSERWIPSFVSPIATMPSLRRFATISDVMLMVLFLCCARETGEFWFVPLYERIRVIIEAQSLTGHMMGSDVLHCVTVSDFLSFFCHLKVIETQSAGFNQVDVWSRMLPSLVKTMLRRKSCFVWRLLLGKLWNIRTIASPKNVRQPRVLRLIIVILWRGKWGWGGRHKQVMLSVVFPLGRFASMISIASVEVAQRGVLCPCVGILLRFLWRSQPLR
jgi:hypothetical protein